MEHCSAVGVIAGTALIWAWACGGAQPEAATPAAEATPPAEVATPSPSPTSSTLASAAPPSESGGPAATAGGDARTIDVIAAVVKEHRQEARACYEKAQQQIPGLKGDMVIHFTLKPNGVVKHAELNEERSTIREASLSTCVIEVITHIQFPRSSKGMKSTVNYPFNFNP